MVMFLFLINVYLLLIRLMVVLPVALGFHAVDHLRFPAMALVQVVALVEDRALVEIEATAVIPEI